MELQVTGAAIYGYLFDLPYLPMTATLVNTWIAMAVIVGLCWLLTHGMAVHPTGWRQLMAECLVTGAHRFVCRTMGAGWDNFVPLIASLFSLSAVCSLMSLTGAFAPTSDLNTLLAWSLLVFGLIVGWKIRTRGWNGYLRSYLEPVPLMAPLNVLSEAAVPVSMAFRHFGNIASGTVISLLLYAALGRVNKLLFRWVPGTIGVIVRDIPFLAAGLPALLQCYFGVFSSLVQPFIFCMLTMLFVSRAAQTEGDTE